MLFQTGKTAKQFQLVFEINDWAAIGASYPAKHPVVQRWMNDGFMHFSDTKRTAGDVEKPSTSSYLVKVNHCIQPAGWMRIETCIGWQMGLRTLWHPCLYPLFVPFPFMNLCVKIIG
jgi:hypothetical protein